MQLTEETHLAPYHINSYTPGKIVINNESYTHNLVLTRDRLIPTFAPSAIDDLQTSDLKIILAQTPEVFILGTGEKQVFPPTVLLQPIIDAQIGYEIMDTLAACRTYNILANENRSVVVALIV